MSKTAQTGKLSLDLQLVQGHWLERGSARAGGGRGLRSCQGGAHCAWSLLPYKLESSPSQGTLGADGSKNKEWGSLRSPRRVETLLPLCGPAPTHPEPQDAGPWVTTAPDDLRAGRGERWPCRSGDRRAAPEPLSAPPSLGWSLGGQGAGGGGLGDGDASTPHTPLSCWPGAGTPGPRASQHPQGSASAAAIGWGNS